MKLTYDRLSRMLSMLPATSSEIAEAIDMREDCVRAWLRQLRADGIVVPKHFVKWSGRVWAAGIGTKYVRSGGEVVGKAVRTFGAAWHALGTRHTTDSLASAIGYSARTASDILRSMKAHGIVRIAGWEIRGQVPAPIYDRLPAASVPRPARVSRSEINAAHWQKRKQRMSEQREAA